MTNKTSWNHGPANSLERLSNPRSPVKEAADWDASSVRRFLAGQQGVPIHKIDALVQAAGYVMIDRELLKAMTTMAEIGIYCHCAKEAGGVPQSYRGTVSIEGNVGQSIAGDASFAAPVTFVVGKKKP